MSGDNTINGSSQINSASTGSGFSIDSIGSLMSDDIQKKDDAVRALLDQIDSNNQQITSGNTLLNSTDSNGQNIDAEITALASAFTNGIPLGQLDQNSFIYQMATIYNNTIPAGQTNLLGGTGPLSSTSLNALTVTQTQLNSIKSALNNYNSSDATLQKIINNAGNIFSDTEILPILNKAFSLDDEINKLDHGLSLKLADLRTLQFNLTTKLVDFYNTNVIGTTGAVNVLGNTGPILESDALSQQNLKDIQAAVMNYPLAADQSVYAGAQSVINDAALQGELDSIKTLITTADSSTTLNQLTSTSAIYQMVNYYNSNATVINRYQTNPPSAVNVNLIDGTTNGTITDTNKLNTQSLSQDTLNNIKTAIQNYYSKVSVDFYTAKSNIQAYNNSQWKDFPVGISNFGQTDFTAAVNNHNTGLPLSYLPLGRPDVQNLLSFYNNHLVGTGETNLITTNPGTGTITGPIANFNNASGSYSISRNNLDKIVQKVNDYINQNAPAITSTANTLMSQLSTASFTFASTIKSSDLDPTTYAPVLNLLNFYNNNLVGAGETNLLGGTGQLTSTALGSTVLTTSMLSAIQSEVSNYVKAYALVSGTTKNSAGQTLDQQATDYFNNGGTNTDLLSQLSDSYKKMVPSNDRFIAATSIRLDNLDPNSAIAQLVNFYNSAVYNNPPISPPPNNILGSSGAISSSTTLSGDNLSSIQTAVNNYLSNQSSAVSNANSDITNLSQGKVTLSELDTNSPITLLVKAYNNIVGFYNNNIFGRQGAITDSDVLNGSNLLSILNTVRSAQSQIKPVDGSTLSQAYSALTYVDLTGRTVDQEINDMGPYSTFTTGGFISQNQMGINQIVNVYFSKVLGQPVPQGVRYTSIFIKSMQQSVQQYLLFNGGKTNPDGSNDLSTAINSIDNHQISFGSLNQNSSAFQLVNLYNATVIGNSNNLNVLGTTGKIQPTDIITVSQLQTIQTTLSNNINANLTKFSSNPSVNLTKDFTGQTLTDEITKLRSGSIDSALYANPATLSYAQYQTMKAQLSLQLLTDAPVENTMNSVIDLEKTDSSKKTLQQEIDGLSDTTGLSLSQLDTSAPLVAQMIRYYNINHVGASAITTITKTNATSVLKTLQDSALHIDAILNTTDANGNNLLTQELTTTSSSSIPWGLLDKHSLVYQLVNWYNDNVIGSDSNTINVLSTKGKISPSIALTQNQISAIETAVKTHIDSLSATSQQTYLDIQQAMNAYNLAISSWTQILQALGRSLDEPLRSIG